MKTALITVTLLISMLAACDVQSGITKQSVEKFGPTPSPSVAATPEPIDPADAVQVDTSVQGPLIPISRGTDRKSVVCDKYNRVMVNSDDNAITIKGACSQIMVNGNRNDISVEAVMEIVFNGGENKVRYSRYGNGKRPNVTDNRGGNLAEKSAAAAAKKQ